METAQSLARICEMLSGKTLFKAVATLFVNVAFSVVAVVVIIVMATVSTDDAFVTVVVSAVFFTFRVAGNWYNYCLYDKYNLIRFIKVKSLPKSIAVIISIYFQ